MRSKYLCVVLLLAVGAMRGAFAQGSCAASPALHVAQFNTNGVSDDVTVTDRLNAMATVLPQTADAQGLDVLCLNELRDVDLRSTVVQGFTSDTTTSWNIYHPTAQAQPGCQLACANDRTFEYEELALPLNKWVEVCSLSQSSPDGPRCVDQTTEAGYQACMNQICGFLPATLVSIGNPQCGYCTQNAIAGESLEDRVKRCAANYAPNTANQCTMGYNGEAGGTLISRYPFVSTEYHSFVPPSNTAQFGLANWGITYGKIQTPIGNVHLFCASHATTESGMDASAAEALNGAQSQDVLNYIQSKANGETAIYMSSTGSGPVLVSSATGPANALWPEDFAVLQGQLTDTLLANVDSSSLPASAAACTYLCSGSTPTQAAYTDHIMTAGEGAAPAGNTRTLCATGGGTLFNTATVSSGGSTIPLSNHLAVLTDISLNKAPTAVSVAPTASPILLGQTLASSTLTGGTAISTITNTAVAGVFTFTNPSASPTSTASQGVTFTPTDTSDYRGTTSSVKVTVIAPIASIAPLSIDFGTLYLGSIVTKTVTIANTGTAALILSDPRIAIVRGGNSSEFVTVNLCPKSLAVGKSCTMTVTFAAGPFYTPQTATLIIVDNAVGSPQSIPLTATVFNPLIQFSPGGLSFGKVKTGTSSGVGKITLTSAGGTAVSINSISLAGANPGDFTETSTCSGLLTSKSTCSISVTFKPSAKGPRSGVLKVVDNVLNSPQVIPLSGTGN